MAIFKQKKADDAKKAPKADAKKAAPKKVVTKKAEAKETKKEAPKEATLSSARATGEAYRIIMHPLVTEKFSGQGTTYAFAVTPKSNKLEIKKAIENAYGTKVEAVRVMNVAGKAMRSRFGYGRRADWRKAIVTLKKGESIDLFTAKNA